MLASGSDPTWDLPAMFGLHKVLSVHSLLSLKQDRCTCRRYMRTVYCQNGEKNGSCLTLSARQSWSTRKLACSSISSNPSLFPSCTFEQQGLGRGTASVSHQRLQRMPSNGGEFSLARSIRPFREAACVKCEKIWKLYSDKKKRVTKPRMHTYTTYERTINIYI